MAESDQRKWLVTKSEVTESVLRWEISNFSAQVSPGWTSILGPVIRNTETDRQLRLQMIPDTDGFLCVELKNDTMLSRKPTGNSKPTAQTILTASIHDASGTQVCSVEMSCCFTNFHRRRLIRQTEVLANPTRFLRDDKLTVICTILYLENRTVIADRLEQPTPIVPPPEVVSCLGTALSQGLFSDVDLVAGDREFPVHRAILAYRSEVFKTMFQTDMTEANERRVVLDISAEVLQDLLTFIYTDSAPNIGNHAEELLSAAEKYNITRLKAVCEAEIAKGLNISNAIDTLVLSDMHRARQLQAAALHWIAGHAGEVVETESWKVLCDNHPTLVKSVCEMFAKYIKHLETPPSENLLK